MLEDPSHQDVARWGKDGDSFVVVEVRSPKLFYLEKPVVRSRMLLTAASGREIHKVHPAEALQAQQHVQLYPAAEQVRLSQGEAVW
jgi:osomolarity two-component system response regulator SKN7